MILSIAMALAARLDEATYRAELKRLAANYRDDPTAAFALIDYYFFEDDFKSAMDLVLGLERAFGADAAIATLKASVAMKSGDLAGAQRFAQGAVDLEPDNEAGHRTAVTAAMEAKQYAAGIKALEALERDFGYEFEAANFAGDEIYAGFVKSPEFAAWTKSR